MTPISLVWSNGIRQKARRAARVGDWKMAADCYRDLVARRLATARDRVQFAHALKETGNTGAAHEAYQAAAAAFPQAIDAQLHLGLSLQRLQRHVDATNALARTLAMDPENRFVREKLAELGIGEDRLDAAMLTGILAGYEAPAARIGPLSGMLRAQRLRQARHHARNREWAAAARDYRRTLAFDPHDARLLVQLGHALLETGDGTQAVMIYRLALVSRPRHPDTYLHLGHALKTVGRHEAAVQAYWTALRLQPDLPAAVRELRAMGWSEAALVASSPIGRQPGDSELTTAPAPAFAMPPGLTSRQESIWTLLAACRDNEK